MLPQKEGAAIQGILFCCCMIILALKKCRDGAARTWWEFALDSSKQLAAAFWLHCTNLFTATLFSKFTSVDACGWYFICIVVDDTLGVFAVFLLMKTMHVLIESALGSGSEFQCGEYRDSETGDIMYRRYLKQLFAHLLVVTCMKALMVILQKVFEQPLTSLQLILLQPLRDKPTLKLFCVMVATPLVMNTLQLWVIDNIIKKGSLHDEATPLQRDPYWPPRRRVASWPPLSGARATACPCEESPQRSSWSLPANIAAGGLAAAAGERGGLHSCAAGEAAALSGGC